VLGSFSSKWGKCRSGGGGAVSVKMSLRPALIGQSSSIPRHSCTHTKSAGSRLIVNWQHETGGAFHPTAPRLWNISLSPTGLEVRGMECDRHSGLSVWRAHMDAASLTIAQLIELSFCVRPPGVGVSIVGGPRYTASPASWPAKSLPDTPGRKCSVRQPVGSRVWRPTDRGEGSKR
jgi:hypothetical protein